LLSEYSCGEGIPKYTFPATRSDIKDFPLPLTLKPYERNEDGTIP